MRAALALGGVVLAVAGCSGGEAASELPLGRQISAAASFSSTVHLFAEPVVARVDVVVDTDHLDPERVRLATRFLPYDVKATAEAREDRGRFAHLRFEFLLRCLRIKCIAEVLPGPGGDAGSGRGERRTFTPRAARVLYDEPRGKNRTVARAAWPELVSVSRIKQSDVPSFGFVFKSSATPLPAPDYRVSPTWLAVGLFGGAAALLAFPAVLVAGWVRRRRPAPEPEVAEPELTPLEKALRLVEWARDRENGAERREALEVLAVELEAVERDSLAVDARTLAWSPVSPSPEAADLLVETVRTDGGS